jgi:hypothetical protein
MLAELGDIDLPPAARGDAMQLRAIASLYLASTLEAAGLIQAADDFTRLARSGALPGDIGEAGPLIEAFWDARNERISEAERLALFGRLFGAPVGPDDVSGGANGGIRLAENIADAAGSMVQMMAREILDSLSQAIAILNHPQVRAMLMARTLWDAVTSIDRRFRRTPRPTLTHLRRGRAGMAVLAWLADTIETIEASAGGLVAAGDLVIDAAIDWVDETLAIVRGEEANAPSPDVAGRPGGASDWRDLGR